MKKKIAELISFILNPALLGMLIIICALIKCHVDGAMFYYLLLGIIALNGVVPGLFYIHFSRQGYVYDDTLDNQTVPRQRMNILLVFLAVFIAQFLLVKVFFDYLPLEIVLSGGILAIIIAMPITYFWKISLHGAMTTFFAIMVIYLFGLSAAWLILVIIPLVFWSRLIMRRHTIWQLLAGFSLAIIVIAIIFAIYGVRFIN